MREFYAILSAGAFGGFLSWLSALVFGGPLRKLPGPAAVGAALLLGAGAATVGVYLIANTDRRDLPRALAFAILCGFSWQITYDGASSMIQRHQARNEAEATTQKVNQTAIHLSSNPQLASVPEVHALVADTKTALKAARQSDSADANGAAVEASLTSLDTLHKVLTPQTAVAATTGVKEIATMALETGHQDVAKKAIDTLAVQPATPASRDALVGIATAAEQQNAPLVRDAATKILAVQTEQLNGGGSTQG